MLGCQGGTRQPLGKKKEKRKKLAMVVWTHLKTAPNSRKIITKMSVFRTYPLKTPQSLKYVLHF